MGVGADDIVCGCCAGLEERRKEVAVASENLELCLTWILAIIPIFQASLLERALCRLRNVNLGASVPGMHTFLQRRFHNLASIGYRAPQAASETWHASLEGG